MPTLAIVGAGPALGLAVAKVFGDRGFDVALISRDKQKLDGLVARLAQENVTAAAFAADVTDRAALTAALQAAARHFGGIDVLEFSPAPHGVELLGPLETTPENLQQHVDFFLYGAVTAARAVLPAMLDAGAGALLFTNGGGSVTPHPMFGNVNPAQAALRNWVINLNGVLADRGVFAGHVAINARIGDTRGPDEVPQGIAPAAIAGLYWDLYERRDRAEVVFDGSVR